MLLKSGSLRTTFAGVLAGAAALCLASGTAAAQSLIAGSNVNVVGGPVCTSDPNAKNYDPNCPYRIFGDVTAQRQNEGSFDCSSRNALNCVGAGNDYRLVGIAGPQDGAITGDSWHGIYWTHDGGATWRSTLLPGWHVGTFTDTSAAGAASPIKQFDATADATVRAGTHGLFYLSGIAFNRGDEVGSSAVAGGEGKTGTTFMAVYIDDNKSSKPEDGPRFVRWSVIDAGSSGRVLDKPWTAVDIPRAGALTTTIPAAPGIPAQTIPCGNVYATYTTFLGEGTNNPHSTVWFKKSADCAATWSNATKIAEGVKLVQSATIGVFPNGDVLVVWREFGLADGTADRILAVKSTNFGKNFTKPYEIANLGIPTPTLNGFSTAFDLVTYPNTDGPDWRQARSNDYPSLCVDNGGATIAFSKRVPQPTAPSPDQGVAVPEIQFSRIVTTSSATGSAGSWSSLAAADNHPYVGHQFQPAVACAGSRRALVWYDGRNDYAFSLLPFAQPPTLGLLITPFIIDGRLIPPAHTIDVRAAQTTGAGSFEPSIQVSKYPIWVQGGTPADVVQLKYNFMSLPLFGGGVLPFIGDYIDLISRNKYVPPTRNHPNWELNDYTAETPSFQSLWTDNRDVVETATEALTQNDVGSTDFSTFATPNLASCGAAIWTRNQNLYTSALSSGFVIRVDGNARRTPNLKKRAYALSLYNGTKPQPGTNGPIKKYFRLTFDGGPTGRSGPASFSYNDTPVVDSVIVEMPALSGAARAVFIDQNQTESVVVLAEEVDAQGNSISNALKGRVIIAPDPTAPVSDLTSEDHDVQLEPLYFQTQLICSTDGDCGGGTCEIATGQQTGFCAMPSVTYGVNLTSDPALVFGDPSLSSTLDPTNFDAGSWGFGNWGFGNWGFGNWGFGNWGFGNWGFGNWGFGNWGFGNWGFGNWGFGNTAITTSSFTVTNSGTVESAYDLDALMQGLPSGSVMQVLVSKIAANPRPQNCNVEVEPSLQLVANASRAGNGALNSSFTLAPNEQAIILVQGSCDPGTETSCYDPLQDLALKVTSQSPDCNSTECVFSVPPDFDIYDVSPPLLTLPANITTPATSASGAVVTYSATATDLIDGSVPVTCSPVSGSTFQVGTTTVNCSAQDNRTPPNVATGSFTVTVTNAAPVASNGTVTTNEDTAVTITLVASDVENDTLTYAIVSGPSHGTLGSVSGSSMTYTPNANFNGADSFTFKASETVNGQTVDSNTATVNISVTAVNDAPVANAVGPITAAEDTPVNITLSASDVDAGDVLTYSIVTAPAHGSLSGTGASRTYTPALDYFGSDSFSFKVNDGTVDSNTVVVSITVNPVADAPRPNNDNYSTNEDTTLTVPAPGVLSNDTDPEGGPLTATLVLNTGPAHAASFALNANGSFTYTPALNYSGSDSFQYTATDSTGLVSAAATVTITVASVDDPGVAVNDSATVLAGGSVVITVLANDTDPDNTLTIASVSTPQHGTAAITNNGTTVTYTSTDSTFSGLDTFTYTLVGGGTATVTVQVNYAVTGVLSPQGPPKSFNAGSAIPIDWQYKNASGVAVDSWGSTLQGQLLTLTFTKMYPTNATNCTGGTEDPAPTLVNTDYPGNSNYQYFGASNPHPTWGPYTWQFNWQTGPPVAPGCWKVRIIFDVNNNNPANAKWQYDTADIVMAFPVKLK